MQPESSSTIHPTRRAPLCTACAHYLPPKPKAVPLQRHHLLARCNHPSTPVNPATGEALATVEQMRARYQPCELNDLKTVHCGLEAHLFAPMQATAPAAE